MQFIGRFTRGALALLACTSVQAADPELPLDEITVSATKIATPLLEVAATVTVITDEATERRIGRDIKDLVRYEPNVSVRNNVARFGLSDFNVRGIQGNRVLVELDNVRIADAFSIGSFSNASRDGIAVRQRGKCRNFRAISACPRPRGLRRSRE